MRDLSVVAENLRLVQRARRTFLEMWSVEQDVIRPMLDQMVADLGHALGTELAAAGEDAGGGDDDDDDGTTGFGPPGPAGGAH